MILDSSIEEAEIDEALTHLSNTIRHAINDSRKNLLLELVDELLDAKIEKTQGNS